MVLEAGRVIEERYEVEAPLGSGGMAEVWRVRHLRLGSRHALKVLHNTAPELAERLAAEGRIQAGLSHPNIVRVTDVVQLGSALGLVMEWVEGPSLRALLSGGPPPLDAALRMGGRILDGVAQAHDQGLIHRDLKPENVLLQPLSGGEWLPRVADFGLARAVERGGPGRTRAGLAMGTPGYMAPEQYRDAAGVDQRADVFALGCVLYELLSGLRAFAPGDVIALYQAALRGDVAPLSALAPAAPPEVAALIHQALRPRPAERPADAAELAALWRAAAAGRGGLPGPSELTTAPLSGDTLDLVSLDALEPPSALPTHRAHNLAPPGDAFIGREEVLQALAARLEGLGPGGLVTLAGPAGVGKSRLAAQLGLALLERLEGGSWRVDLSGALDEEGAEAALAAALGVPPGGPGQTAARALAARGRALVVLDGLERAAPALTGTLARWRSAAPQARFVACSRAVLGLPGEAVVRLEPLDPGPAAALFVARARERRPAVEQEVADVAALVALLDGLPLAIELAAARAGLLSPAAMIARIQGREGRLRLLRGRGGSLQGALDLSWSLLEGWERSAFAQLSTFEGSFTLEAAEAVLDLSGLPGPDGLAPWPLDAVEALVDRSLVRTLAPGPRRPEPRFLLYRSLREYAAARLAAGAADGDAASERFVAWYADFGAPEAREALHRRGGVGRWWALCEDLENLAAAARAAPGAREAALAALALCDVVERRGPVGQGVEALEAAAARLRAAGGPEVGALLGTVQIALGNLLVKQGRGPGAAEQLTEALEGARARGDRRAEGGALAALGTLRWREGALDEAQEELAEALAIHREVGDRRAEGAALGNLGGLRAGRGELGAAAEALEAALALHRSLGNRRSEGVVLANLGALRARMGQGDAARALYQQALAIHRETGERRAEGEVLANVAILAHKRGQLAEAEARYQAALAAHREVGSRRAEGAALGNLATLYSQRGRPEPAEACFREALAIHREVGDRQAEGSALGNLGALQWGRGQLAEARESLDAALAAHREVGNRRAEAAALANLGMLHHQQGRPAQARAHYEAVLVLCRALGDRRTEGVVLSNLGELERARGHPGRARELLEQALEVQQSLGDRRAEGVVAGNLGALDAAAGDAAAAGRWLERAEALLRGVGDPLELGAVLVERGAMALSGGDRAAAEALLEEAEALALQADAGPESALGRAAADLRDRLEGTGGA